MPKTSTQKAQSIYPRFTKFLRIDGLCHDAALGKVNRAGNPSRNNSGQHATREMAKVTLLQKACRAQAV